MAEVLQVLIIFLKILIPASMLKFPLLGLWGNYFLDVVDGDILLSLGMSDARYQLIDKSTDFISYIFMLILGLRWSIKKIVIILFAYRVAGQILFFTTGNELVFLYFQNFLEPLMMIYALILFKQKDEKKAYLTYKKHLYLIWAIVLIYKIWNEWYLHFANIDLSMLFFGFTGGVK
ncbi:hypothetical protein HYU96_01640 [Candidatus Daviesbacteria bacterium]|nr:hypothetical protein [Candidatus Daviesbacteria bacterium]